MPPKSTSLCPSPDALAARIQAERLRLGLTQQQAADALGVSQGSFKQLEQGKTCPSLGTIFSLVKGLGMNPRALLPELYARAGR